MDTPKKGTSMKRRTRSPLPASDVEQRLPKYSIGVVSQLIGVSPQMLRRYEEAGLVEPARLTGKNRLYSDQDVATLEEIAALAEQEMTVRQRQFAHLVTDHLRLLKTHRSLFHFKQKFHPCWRSRYVAISSTLALPKLALALLRVHHA